MRQKNPLAKLEGVITIIGVLTILGLLTTVPSVLGGRGDFFWFGTPDVCANVPSDALVNVNGHGISGAHVASLAQGVRAHASDFDLCANEPTLRQRALATTVDLSRYLFFLGFLFITWRLTRRGRRRGVFTSDIATAVDRLSVYLFVGAFVVAFVRALATQKLVATMLVNPAHNDWLRYAHLSWVLIIVAFGLQAMARVIGATVPMKAEIDATV
jgi:hypothetical protein